MTRTQDVWRRRVAWLVITLLLLVATVSLLVADSPQTALLSVLVIVAAILCLLLYVSDKAAPVSPPAFARAIAERHLTQFEDLAMFRGLRTGSVYPVYTPFSKEPSAYDVKLVSEDQADSGYMLVNLDKADFPLMFFS